MSLLDLTSIGLTCVGGKKLASPHQQAATGRQPWGRFFFDSSHVMSRRFPQPWSVEQIPGGYKVLDATGQSLAYVYGRDTKADADIAKVLTMDEARRIAPIAV